MAKLVGSPKTGGREKGTPNKRTRSFLEVLDARGIDPLSEILNLSTGLDNHEKIRVYGDLLPYLYPKRKPVEIPFDFNEHLSLLDSTQLETLHSQLEKKLGFLPRSSDFPRTQEELKIKIASVMQELEDEV